MIKIIHSAVTVQIEVDDAVLGTCGFVDGEFLSYSIESDQLVLRKATPSDDEVIESQAYLLIEEYDGVRTGFLVLALNTHELSPYAITPVEPQPRALVNVTQITAEPGALFFTLERDKSMSALINAAKTLQQSLSVLESSGAKNVH